MAADLKKLERTLGHVFADEGLLIRALTHKSRAAERRTAGAPDPDNERLEFLGDAVLQLVVSEWLLDRYPESAEGQLSILRARLVSSAHLSEVAARLSLGDFLQLGRSEEKGGGRGKNRLLANALEAVIAAIYVDGGFNAARRFLADHVISPLDLESESDEQVNYKGPLQERAQELGLPQPRYVIVSTKGPEHSKTFVVEVRVGSEFTSQGEGQSKKSAGQQAARLMLERLDGASGG